MWPDTQRYTVLQTDSGQYKNIHNLFPALGVINRYTDMIDSSDTHAVFTEYRGPIESFITWCNENHLKLNINNELVLDYCCVSISVQALGTTVSWTVKVLECVHMFGQLSWLIEHKEQNKKTFLKKTLWNIDVSQASSSQQHRRSPQSAPFKGGHSGSVPPIQYPTKCGIW